MTSETISVKPQHIVFGELGRNWSWLLALGILFVVLGFIGLGMVFAVTMVSVLMFGFLLLAGSIVQLIDAIKCKGWKGIMLHITIALLYLFASISIIADPLDASALLTLIIASVLIVVGFARGIMGFQMKSYRNWFWPVLSGFISIVLGIFIVTEWPVSGLWVIGLFVSIELILNGWSYIFLSLSAKSARGGELNSAPSGQ